MFRRLLERLKQYPREKWLMPAVVTLSVVTALWVAGRDNGHPGGDGTELSTSIPKGFLVVPLELMNASSLSSLVSKNAVLDIFDPSTDKAVVENLRVIKLSAGDGPLFGALVPDAMAGRLQEVFSRPKLRGAVRTLNAGPTSFHLNTSSKPLLTEVSVGE